jgi:Ras-related protein Rab-11A
MDSSKTYENIKFSFQQKSLYKIGLFCDSNVGKTSLIRKYLTGKVPSYPMSTLTMEFAIKLNEIDRGGYIKTQIWDTPGREQYRDMTFHNINNFLGGIILYDITKRSTFENVLLWMKILKERSEKNCLMCLVGNKLDKVKKQPSLREISKEEGETFAFLNHMIFFETSVFLDDCEQIFDSLIQSIYNEQRKFLYKSDIMENYFDIQNSNNESIHYYNTNYPQKESKCLQINFENTNENPGCKCHIF